jgi:preprotein translocase subunit YajC
MPGLSAAIPVLLAQNAPAGGGGGSGLMSTWMLILPPLIIFYFLLLRPQQQQEKKRKQMLEALKKNDRVLTAAGIYGTVVSVDNDNDKVVLRVDDDRGVKLAFSRASVVRVIDVSQEKEKAAELA